LFVVGAALTTMTRAQCRLRRLGRSFFARDLTDGPSRVELAGAGGAGHVVPNS